MIVNAGHPEGSRELEKVLAAGVRSAFPHVRAWDITVISTLLVAGDQVPDGARVAAAEPPDELRELFDSNAAEIRPAIIGDTVYTDDKAPVEWLIDRSIVSYAAEN